MSDSKTAKKIEVVPCPIDHGKFLIKVNGRFLFRNEGEGRINGVSDEWCGTEAEAQQKAAELAAPGGIVAKGGYSYLSRQPIPTAARAAAIEPPKHAKECTGHCNVCGWSHGECCDDPCACAEANSYRRNCDLNTLKAAATQLVEPAGNSFCQDKFHEPAARVEHPTPPEYIHLLTCSGNRKFPPGTKDISCSCHLISSGELQYLRESVRVPTTTITSDSAAPAAPVVEQRDFALIAAEKIFALFKNASYFSTRNSEHKQQMVEGWAEIIRSEAYSTPFAYRGYSNEELTKLINEAASQRTEGEGQL